MRAGFFSTDTQKDVVESVETALEYVVRVNSDPSKWKWFVIALHSALQGAMVLVLERGNGLQALTNRSREHWLRAYRERQELPEVYLNHFLNLYEDIKTDVALPYVMSKTFTAEKRHDASMKKLNELRNKWTHFAPKTWAIESLYVARTSQVALEVLCFLLNESQAFFWTDAQLAVTARSALAHLAVKLAELETTESSA